MRVSMVSVVLSAGIFALGACSASVGSADLTLAERAAQCSADSELVPTGQQTGDTRRDFRCQSRGHLRGNARDSAGLGQTGLGQKGPSS
jgi:hypothetical protein